LPGLTVEPVLKTAVSGVLGPVAPDFSLAVWHGWNLPLAMSIAGVVGGLLFYFALRRLFALHDAMLRTWGRHLFHLNVEKLFNAAWRYTGRVAAGGIRRSLFWMIVVVLVVGAMPFLGEQATLLAGLPGPRPMPPLGWLLWAVLVGATLATVAWHGKRLTALIVIGATGLMVSIAFAMLSAPDLALTQLLVEMVTIALMMMALNYLPKQSKQARTPFRRWRDALISIFAGAGIAGLAYAMLVRDPDGSVSAEMLARSLPEAYGANVVNVILADFRGFDTFGEITVFAVAALVVHAMLRWARLRPDELMPGPPVQLPIPADLTQLLFPLAMTVSIYLFLRGHNAPGGGFIAGLAIAVPVLIKYVLQGARAVESTFGFDYVRGISLGLALAAAG